MFALLPSPTLFLRSLLRLLLGLSLMATVGTGYAKPDNVSDAEMNLLPRY